jgi:hypothetical protein
MLSDDVKQKLQWALALAVVVAALRTGYILYDRHEANVAFQARQQAKDAGYADADWYVAPKKLHPYDLKSAKQLTQQPVWVREGYTYTYYPYNAGAANFAHEAGLLGPLQPLQIRDVVTANSSKGRQVVAVFQENGSGFAVPIGVQTANDFRIDSDDMFFIEDPHEMYKHWPAEIWKSVDAHEAKVGMKELQVDFAIGIGVPDGSTPGERTIHYANGGKPMVVTFEGGKAVKVEPDPSKDKGAN